MNPRLHSSKTIFLRHYAPICLQRVFRGASTKIATLYYFFLISDLPFNHKMDLMNLTTELSPEELHKLLTDLQQSQAARLECETQMRPSGIATASCPPNFDSVLCWPQTTADSMAVLPCMEELNGIKYDTSREYATALLYEQFMKDCGYYLERTLLSCFSC